MSLRLVLLVTVVLLTGGSLLASDLYYVKIQSETEAAGLRLSGAIALTRASSGYLVLADNNAETRMSRSGLNARLVASDIGSSELAISINFDRNADGNFPLLYEDVGLRLYRIPSDLFATASLPTRLAPLRGRSLPVRYDREDKGSAGDLRYDVDLQTIIDQVNQDSLETWSHYMESRFWRRVAGTTINNVARNWLAGKFAQFGYDSVVIQPFEADIDGDVKTCHNIIACKTGTTYPMHQIILGAHRDAVPESPGSDDNGSGVCTVLEMARLIAQLETKLTFTFILFDAEEWGLLGSEFYAENAFINGDSIVLMINTDMNANYENSNEAHVYYEYDHSPYIDLWINLADSLNGIDITGYEGEFGFSDHVSFSDRDYAAIFPMEYYLSPFLHSNQDSTCYMNYDYMTRMVKASLATALAVDDSYTPAPMTWYEFPEGLPATIYPDRVNKVPVTIRTYAGSSPVPATSIMYYAVDGGAFQEVVLEHVSGEDYLAPLPAIDCQSYVDYYFNVYDTSGALTTSPIDNRMYSCVGATRIIELINDDFSEDLGWSVSGNATDGVWERGIPIDLYLAGVPQEDYDGSGFCYQTAIFYTHDVDGGTTSLATPIYSISNKNVLIQYARWYNNVLGQDPNNDSMLIRAYDGTFWNTIETVGPVEDASGGWVYRQFWLDEYVTPGSVFRLRFDASDLGADSHVEAAIGAVRLTQYSCDPLIITEMLPDWTVGVEYSQLLDAAGGSGTLTYIDKYDDLSGSGLVLSGNGSLTGTPTAAGTLTFTAEVTDEAMATDERLYEFYVNAPISIETTTLPEAQVSVFYTITLEATGGTGAIVWSDLNDDLVLYGLGIVENRIEGTPTDTATLELVIRAEDEVGAISDRNVSLTIGPYYICGDANGDGSGPDISDLVYLVAYMFQSGPEPPVIAAVDVDSSGSGPDINDLVYLVSYMFQQGPEICPE